MIVNTVFTWSLTSRLPFIVGHICRNSKKYHDKITVKQEPEPSDDVDDDDDKPEKPKKSKKDKGKKNKKNKRRDS